MNELDTLGHKYGTDKASPPPAHFHGYLNIYERYFAPIRESVKTLLEIGVGHRGSYKMWKEYFPNAEVFGLDDWSELSIRPTNDDEGHIVCGDQSSRKDLSRVVNKMRGQGFNIIIDDGGHTMEQQQVSLGYLFKHLTQGGLYVIEDLHTSYANGTKFNPTSTKYNTLRMLRELSLQQECTSDFVTPEEKRYWELYVESVQIEKGIYSEIAFIKKRTIDFHRRLPDETFAHFVVTRFNLGLYTSETLDKNGVKLSSMADEWMTHRLNLFEQICAPSMRAQTSQNFTWVIICDRETPVDIMQCIQSQADNIVIINDVAEGEEKIALEHGIYRDKRVGDVRHIITTSCDNDDALNIDYIRQVQEIVPNVERALISFPRFEVWHKASGTTVDVIAPSNMYLSMVEAAGNDLHTVLAIMRHGDMTGLYHVVQIDKTYPMMLCVIHEYNIYNKLEGNVQRNPDWSKYGIVPPVKLGEIYE